MATITKRDNSYHIMVSCGYDVKLRQIRKCMTWNPETGMTPRQIEKAVNEAAVLFENKVKSGLVLDGNVRFVDFVDRWMKDYANTQLAPKTLYRYRGFLDRIIPALGHIHMDKLQPQHLIEFYSNLAKDGLKSAKTWTAKPALLEAYRAANEKITLFSQRAGLGSATVYVILRGQSVARRSAEKMASALGLSLKRAFIEKEGKTCLSPKTIRHFHALISAILNTAVFWQVILNNPAERVRPPRVPRTEAHYLDDVQTGHLLECLETEPIKYQAMIKLFLYSGMRRGELAGLEWSDINWDKNMIKIQRSSQYLPDRGIFTKETKTASSDRTIKLPREAFAMLRSFKAWQAQEKLKLGQYWNETNRIFTAFDGQPIHPDSITGWFTDFIKRHDLPQISIHSLRHTNITLMIMAGVPLRTVAMRAGHASTATTSVIYSHAIQTAE